MTIQPIPAADDILIVEDSATQAEQLRHILEHHGYAVRVARHGLEALDRLHESRPLLVISDINMPEMNGYDLCRRIRADGALADLPIILLTSLSDPDDVVLGLESGADNFVTKPVDEEYLLSRIRYIMANRHLRSLEGTRISLEISVRGRKHNITADRLQMLHLLLSTYESAMLRSKQLAAAQEELRQLNESLEQKVRERTAALTAEVAERQRLNDELHSSEEKYRLMFESNPLPMWVFDCETLRFLTVNEAAVRHYGYSREEFLAMTIADIRPPQQVSLLLASLQKPSTDLQTDAWTHRKKDGTLIEVEITSHELPFAGRPARLVLANDITERRRAEAALRRSEERFRRMFGTSPVAKCLGRFGDRITEMNEAFCALVGYSRAELLGKAVDELQLWSDPEQRSKVRASLLAGEHIRNREIQLRRKSGEIRTVLVSIELLQFDSHPEQLATLVDITEQKALTAQLNRIQRLDSVGQLAGGIAHDMNNILAPIMMGAPLLRMNLPPAEVEHTLATIEASAQRGAALVRQLTIFSRGVEGERRPLRVANVVSEVTRMAEQTFPKNIEITVQAVDHAWPVHGDTTQLLQVLLNLFVNARDAMPGGGQLTVTAENTELDAQYTALNPDARPGKYVVVRVADTGMGIPHAIVDRIFDPFFTTKEVGKGTGLGLSNVLGIVKGHGGFVRVQSEPERGSSFEIYLPASPDAATSRPPIARSTAQLQGKGELILIIDDEEHIRTILRATLAQHNYRVLTAADGVEATAVFAGSPEVSLVVTDLDMPVMDGINVARVLRQMNPELPFLISTGWTDRGGADTRREELRRLGIRHILVKPYTAEKLLEAVRDALSRRNHAGA